MPPQKHELHPFPVILLPALCHDHARGMRFHATHKILIRLRRFVKGRQNLGKRRSESQSEDEHETTRQSVV